LHRNQADDPRVPRAIQQIGHAVHQVAPMRHLFPESGDGPGQCHENQHQLEISVQGAKKPAGVWLFVQYPHEKRRGRKNLQPFQQDSGGDSHSQRDLPTPVTARPMLRQLTLRNHSDSHPNARRSGVLLKGI
jgi:hypothetical protein